MSLYEQNNNAPFQEVWLPPLKSELFTEMGTEEC